VVQRISIWRGAALGGLAGVGVAGVSVLGQLVAGLPSPAYALFEWLVRVLPGRLLSIGIDATVGLVSKTSLSTSAAAKLAEHGMALVLLVVACAVAGALLAAAARAHVIATRLPIAGAVLGLVLVAPLVVSTGARGAAGPVARVLWFAALAVLWGLTVGRALQRGAVSADELRAGRRLLVGGIAAGGAAGLAALGIGRIGRQGVARSGVPAELPATSGPAASPSPEALARRFAPVPHTRPEITANDAFYRIDINLQPPALEARTWRLRLDGLVRNPLTLTIDELRAMPAITQAITLECISNRVGGDLIGTSLWTGVPLEALLERAKLNGGRAINIEAADGFHETVEMELALDRYGMKQPKWIRRLEVTDSPRPGYWVERGWDQQAIVKTTAVVDTVATSMMLGEVQTLGVGGIAYAGARGISRVEVQVDDGPWHPADLRAPPLGPLTWVQWRYAWPYRRGRHVFRARAYDGTGALQPTAMQPPHPSGASGVHELVTTV
jgi:DMSO/TMAO reductase YedYZ molybdopterin-dependent catalytic subunit